VDNEHEQQASRIELILGDAIYFMAKSGAGPEALGPFALKFSGKLSQRLGPVETALFKLDALTKAPKLDVPADKLSELVASISILIERMSAMEKFVGLNQVPGQPLSNLDEQTPEIPTRLKVKTPEGLTTISMPSSLLNAAIHFYGSKKQAHHEINLLYAAAPIDAKSKSKWISAQLRQRLSQPK